MGDITKVIKPRKAPATNQVGAFYIYPQVIFEYEKVQCEELDFFLIFPTCEDACSCLFNYGISALFCQSLF